jgi:WD40 repeat protein
VKSVKSHSNRIDLEKEIELRFVRILRLFSRDLGVEIPRCRNTTVDLVNGVITPELQRQTSQTTRIYTSEWENPNFEQGSPTVKFVKHLGIPDHLQALYEAKFSGDGLIISQISNVFNGVECDDGLVLLQQKEDLVWLIYNGIEIQTSFNCYPTCLIVERSKVFVGKDHRIECFDLKTLKQFATLNCVEVISNEASLTMWYDWIILGFGHSLLFWEMPLPDCDPKMLLQTLPIICQPEISNITSISSIGEFLAIASFDYPVVHIYRLENGIPTLLSRLISHTGGITALRSTSDSRLFTGSADATIQLWSVQDGVLELQCDRHGGAVTVISFTATPFGNFLFTGGRDSMVRAWDCLRKKGMWQLSVGENVIPIALHFDPKTQKLMVLSRSADDLLSTQLNTYTFGLG